MCPSRYIGQEMMYDLHVISSCDGCLPAAGGLIDQTMWYLELKTQLDRDEMRIKEYQASRRAK